MNRIEAVCLTISLALITSPVWIMQDGTADKSDKVRVIGDLKIESGQIGRLEARAPGKISSVGWLCDGLDYRVSRSTKEFFFVAPKSGTYKLMIGVSYDTDGTHKTQFLNARIVAGKGKVIPDDGKSDPEPDDKPEPDAKGITAEQLEGSYFLVLLETENGKTPKQQLMLNDSKFWVDWLKENKVLKRITRDKDADNMDSYLKLAKENNVELPALFLMKNSTKLLVMPLPDSVEDIKKRIKEGK